ncbi:MAG: hypothetical protein PHH77_04010 [Victivallaceae bacterium]|nr:hypothetical protein [Victivallaceae bacterium]
MLTLLKSKGRLLLFAVLTVFSLFLLGAAEIDADADSIADDGNAVIIRNLIECNTQLYNESDASWRELLHNNPMFMLRIEASVLP